MLVYVCICFSFLSDVSLACFVLVPSVLCQVEARNNDWFALSCPLLDSPIYFHGVVDLLHMALVGEKKESLQFDFLEGKRGVEEEKDERHFALRASSGPRGSFCFLPPSSPSFPYHKRSYLSEQRQFDFF